MSFQITENFVQQFSSNFHILGQQKASRLLAFVQNEGHITGTAKTVERLGKAEANPIQSRNSDTQYVQVPHSRRWLDLQDWDWAELVDELDKVKMLADPTSPYVKLAVASLNRKKDDVILQAALGTARTANAGNIPLPVTQKIADGGTGLTLVKLMAAKEMLDIAEVDDELDMDGQGSPQRVMVVSARQLTNLLGTTEIKSVDYNNVKALVNGQVDTFLGFKFIRTERLPKVANVRQCVAWTRGCIAFGSGMDTRTSIDIMPSKRYATQVYARESVGAVRVEDEGVVEIDCTE